ncbi:MAG: transcriptional regulator [Rhizobiaceae bacterium]
MQTSTFRTERERQAAEALLSQYRAIGPAAVLAALLCQPQKPKAALQQAA